MKRIKITLIVFSQFLTLLFPIFTFSQSDFSCTSDELKKSLLQEDEEYASKMEKFEKEYRKKILQHRAGERSKVLPIYELPFVIHAIHSGEPIGDPNNPDDNYYITRIDDLTDRFRHTQTGANVYSTPFDTLYGADSEIEFCLTHEDELGNYTNGIKRYFYPDTLLPLPNSFYEDKSWDTNKYINIFLSADIGGAIGYYSPALDIIVNLQDEDVGVWAHETGHYLSLWHSFQDLCPNDDCLLEGDFVSDTSPQQITGPCGNNSCSTDPDDSSTNNPYRQPILGGLGDQNDVLENFMSYSSVCWDCFTTDQAIRMRSYIDVTKPMHLTNSVTCSTTTSSLNDAGVHDVYIDHKGVCNETPEIESISINNFGSNDITSLTLEFLLNGSLIHSIAWTGVITSGQCIVFLPDYSFTLPIGNNDLEIRTVNPNGQVDSNPTNDAPWLVTLGYLNGDQCAAVTTCVPLNPDSDLGLGNVTEIIAPTSSLPLNFIGEAEICVYIKADMDFFGLPTPFNIFNEDGVLKGETHTDGVCTGTTPFCFMATNDEYYAWTSDGSLLVTVEPLIPGLSFACTSTNEACIDVYPFGGACKDELNLFNPVITADYYTRNAIMCTSEINASGDVVFHSDTIDLQQGFEVPLGSIFETILTGCN